MNTEEMLKDLQQNACETKAILKETSEKLLQSLYNIVSATEQKEIKINGFIPFHDMYDNDYTLDTITLSSYNENFLAFNSRTGETVVPSQMSTYEIICTCYKIADILSRTSSFPKNEIKKAFVVEKKEKQQELSRQLKQWGNKVLDEIKSIVSQEENKTIMLDKDNEIYIKLIGLTDDCDVPLIGVEINDEDFVRFITRDENSGDEEEIRYYADELYAGQLMTILQTLIMAIDN